MKRFTHQFVYFDPLASSLLSFPGLLNQAMKPVFLTIGSIHYDNIAWTAAKAFCASVVSSDIDGPSIDEFDEAMHLTFVKIEGYRKWLIDLPPEQRVWAEKGKVVDPHFEDRDFTYIVDIYSTLLVEEFPSNPDWQADLQACVPPLALAVLVLVDTACVALAHQEPEMAQIPLVIAASLCARMQQIPKMMRSPQTLAKMGGIAKNKGSRHLQDFARNLYEARRHEFKNPSVASVALWPEVWAEAERKNLDYNELTFENRVYRWLLKN